MIDYATPFHYAIFMTFLDALQRRAMPSRQC
jgi:hypothetical protein